MKRFFLLFVTTLCAFSSTLELGLGGGAMFYPNYMGSKVENQLFIPYPYIHYESEKLRIDRDGLKQKFLHYGDFSVELSAAGTLPIESSGARTGMKELNPAFELGPALMYSIYKDKDLNIQLDLPIRAVFSSDFKSLDYHGYIYELRAEFDYKINDYELKLYTGPVFANSKYHNYLYGVKTSEVSTSRAFYEAEGGYSSFKTSIGVSKRFKNIWAGAFLRHYSLTNSTIKNSPLVERNSALYSGVFVAYIFDDNELTRSMKNWLK